MTRIDERQVITADNVKWLGEMIALMSAKNSDKMFCHSKVTQLYRGLISDIFYNNQKELSKSDEIFERTMHEVDKNYAHKDENYIPTEITRKSIEGTFYNYERR